MRVSYQPIHVIVKKTKDVPATRLSLQVVQVAVKTNSAARGWSIGQIKF